MIPEKFIEQVQARVDLVEVISGYLPLKKTGRNFKACCPFHSEKTPSFIVSPQKQIFHCFGCGQGGGVFQFLMQIEKVNFPEAVEMLAKKIGVTIPYQKSKDGKLKTSCFEAVEAAAQFYHETLKSKNCELVMDYLKKRKIALKTIDTFYLGFAPGRNFLLNHMRKRGFTLDTLEKASLVSSGRSGFRDVFSDRIIFPIFDIRDRAVGFGARIWQQKEGSPKYINSGESSIYSKRKALFGLNLAKQAIVKEGFVYIVEGYLDMIIPFMRGIDNIVASLGTSLTIEQIKLVARFCSRVVLVFDSDSAGQLAMMRSIDLLLENQIQTQIVELPAGEDPDSIVRKKGKEYFLSLIKEPLDFFDFKLGVLEKQLDSKSIEDKSKIVEQMLSTLSKIKDEVKRYQYLAKLAQRLKINEEAVIAEYRRRFLSGQTRGGFNFSSEALPSQGELSKGAPSITEKILIKAVFTDQRFCSLVRNNFKVEDFTHPLAQKAISFLFNRFPKNTKISGKLTASITDKVVSGFISRIILEDDIPQDEASLRSSLIKLRKKHIQEEKEQLKIKIKQADSQGDRKKLEELINQYNKINSGVANE